MDRVLRSGLIERGWEVQAADFAAKVDREPVPLSSAVWDGVLFYSILGISIFANFVVSLVLIPILMVVTEVYLLLALAFVGLAFGMFLEAIIKETERFRTSKLLVPELFIPAVAMINVYIATQLANRVAILLLLPTGIKNPLLTSVVYVVAFMIPHFWRKFRMMKKEEKAAAAQGTHQ